MPRKHPASHGTERCQSRQRVGLNDMAFPVDRKDTTMSTSTSPRLIRPRKNRFKTRVTWHSPTSTHRAGIPTALPRGHTRVPKALESTAHQNRVPKKKNWNPIQRTTSSPITSRLGVSVDFLAGYRQSPVGRIIAICDILAGVGMSTLTSDADPTVVVPNRSCLNATGDLGQ